jgi:hypothetical protein
MLARQKDAALQGRDTPQPIVWFWMVLSLKLKDPRVKVPNGDSQTKCLEFKHSTTS